jgi:hypothetical protein
MRRSALWALSALLALAASGCYLGHFIVALTKPKEYKHIKAEYYLEAERLAIVPYVGTDIQFRYPTASVEIPNEVVYALGRHLKDKVRTVVPPLAVVQWQESNLEWPNLSLDEIGRRFQADAVLYLELEQYTMLEENSANLLRGRARVRVQVAKAGADRSPVYSGLAEVLFPKDHPVSMLQTSERTMRQSTNRLLGEEIVNKFFDRKVEVVAGEP